MIRAIVSFFDARDIVALVGLILIGAGLAFVSVAAALAVPGALVFLCAVLPVLRGPRGKEQ